MPSWLWLITGFVLGCAAASVALWIRANLDTVQRRLTAMRASVSGRSPPLHGAFTPASPPAPKASTTSVCRRGSSVVIATDSAIVYDPVGRPSGRRGGLALVKRRPKEDD